MVQTRSKAQKNDRKVKVIDAHRATTKKNTSNRENTAPTTNTTNIPSKRTILPQRHIKPVVLIKTKKRRPSINAPKGNIREGKKKTVVVVIERVVKRNAKTIKKRKHLKREELSESGRSALPVLINQVQGPLPGREQEYFELHKIVTNALINNQGACVYVSGVPGTGKTATVRACLASIATNHMNSFDAIEINAMQIRTATQLYSTIYQKLYPNETLKRHHMTQKIFNGTTRPCVIVVDELDLLASDAGLYRLFEWPNEACVVVIAIANTMDLPERFLSTRIASRLGLCRVNFKPYGHSQLIAIIKLHLKDGSITQDAVEYCARKIASVSGDARRAIALAQRALEECRVEGGNMETTLDASVTLDAMIRTISKIASTSHVMQLTDLSLNHKHLLLSVYLSSAGEMQVVQVSDVIERQWQLCRAHNLTLPSHGHILDMSE